MAGFKQVLLTIFLLLSSTLAATSDIEKRPTRTIARFLGLERTQPAVVQQPVVQQQFSQQPPLVYNVKYYDRVGENPPEVQVQEVVQQQGQQHGQQQQVFQDRVIPSTRVFLNLYTGQQTPVYYDTKGQLYVPCPTYDHHHVHSKPVQVQKSAVLVPGQQQQQPAEFYYQQQQQQQQKQQGQQQQQVIPQQQRQQIPGPQQQPFVTSAIVPADYLYYASPQQSTNPRVPVPATAAYYPPYEVPYPYNFPYNYPPQIVYQQPTGYVNPFVVVKPAAAQVSQQQQQQQQQTDHVVVEKKAPVEKIVVEQQGQQQQ